MAKSQRIRLGILFGGRSAEHEVSRTSAASVISALNPEEFRITAIGITKEGRLASAAQVREMLPAHLHARICCSSILGAGKSPMHLIPSLSDGDKEEHSLPDIIFPLLHGPYGEDGTIQGVFEIAGCPFVGCGVLASAVGMDKDVSKRLFVQSGLPVLPYRVVESREVRRDLGPLRHTLAREFGYPMFSKPANLGSSVGVRKIHGDDEFDEAVRFSALFDRKIIIEKGIGARELECAVLGNDEPEASVVGEIFPANEFYDYDAKYRSTDSRLEIPACIADNKSEEIRSIAVAAFRAIDGSGLSRADFLMDRNTGEVWLNEINTMPGFTPISMYPKLWAAGGVSFPELVRRLVRLGFERYKERCERRISDG